MVQPNSPGKQAEDGVSHAAASRVHYMLSDSEISAMSSQLLKWSRSGYVMMFAAPATARDSIYSVSTIMPALLRLIRQRRR